MKCQACGKEVKDVLEHVEHILHECGKNPAVSPGMSSVPPDAVQPSMHFSGCIK